MFTTLTEAIAHNVVLAGPAYAWDVKGTSRPRSDAQVGLRVWLWTAQGGMCAACGDSVAVTEGEVAHVVSNHGSDSKGRGYVAGNLYFAHESCNADDWEVFGPVVPAHGFARADLVSLTYPTRQEMLDAANTFAGSVSSAMADVRARRLARRIALREAGNASA